jgi:hypothetical protein
MRRRSLVGAAVAIALGLAACGGSAQPGSTVSSSSAPTPSVSTSAGSIAGSFRACHQTPGGTAAMIIFFSSTEPAIVAAGSQVVFRVVPTDPTAWATGGGAVHLRHGGGWNPRRWAVSVPLGVTPPAEMTFHVSVASSSDPGHELAPAQDVTIAIPSSSCAFS